MIIRRIALFLLFSFFLALPCLAEEQATLYLVKNTLKPNLDNFTKVYLAVSFLSSPLQRLLLDAKSCIARLTSSDEKSGHIASEK